MGGHNFTAPHPAPSWFSLNDSETVNVVTLAFCSIQQHFIADIGAKFGIPDFPQSSDIGPKLDGGISNFQISGQFLIKENCHNFRTSNDIDMKHGPAKQGQKILPMMLCRKIVMSLSFF